MNKVSYMGQDQEKYDKQKIYIVSEEDTLMVRELIKDTFTLQNMLVHKENSIIALLSKIQNNFNDLFALSGGAGIIKVGELTFNITCNSKSGYYIPETNSLEIKNATE